MKRRMFFGNIATCLPFLLFRGKKCPYRIEEDFASNRTDWKYFAFYDGNECVGYYTVFDGKLVFEIAHHGTFVLIMPPDSIEQIAWTLFELRQKLDNPLPSISEKVPYKIIVVGATNFTKDYQDRIGPYLEFYGENKLVGGYDNYEFTFNIMHYGEFHFRPLLGKLTPEHAAWRLYKIRQILES